MTYSIENSGEPHRGRCAGFVGAIQSSLRDLGSLLHNPTLERVGYSQISHPGDGSRKPSSVQAGRARVHAPAPLSWPQRLGLRNGVGPLPSFMTSHSDKCRVNPSNSHFGTHVVPASAGGAPTLPDALDCWILKTAVQPKETKEAKEFEGFMQTRSPTYRVNGNYLRTSFLSAFFVSFGHPTAGLSLTPLRLKPGLRTATLEVPTSDARKPK